MNLKYRIWYLAAPTGSPLNNYSVLPLAMIERESAYIRRDQMYAALNHAAEGGKRVDQEWPMIYVHTPGMRSTTMDPNVERWESFGPGWGKFHRMDKILPPLAAQAMLEDLDDWVTLVSLDPPATTSLADWVRVKNLYEWQDLARKRKEEARKKES